MKLKNKYIIGTHIMFFEIDMIGEQTTSLINAIKTAKKNNIIIVGLTGNSISQIIKYSDIKISIPSNDTQRIQEGHILVGHIICEIIEEGL